MSQSFKSDKYRYDGTAEFHLKKAATKIEDIYKDKADYTTQLADFRTAIDELQSLMYAHNRYGLLVIFQAMDAAGKDSTIKHVLSGVNPVGVKIQSFKRPSDNELDHDFLWRHLLHLPERGNITIFNRSYYEEVLVVKVHPEILTKSQRLPKEVTKDLNKVWKQRYNDIVNFEKYLYHNGIRVVKFFLNISQQEQGRQLIERIEDPTKNWKFEEDDIKERAYWKEYMNAYEEAINATATEKAPWYVVPADNKKNMRLLVGQILIEELKNMKMSFPETTPERHTALQNLIQTIHEQDGRTEE
ncbi:polyphosphate kinase 2 family protein [Runella slithyformis]|uniref:Polyphosphate:nucleotide phosphotransferase, PPK2 family n=1 Tax=Runella slithyformis (strain ATCC 29530 / DSM 19594 / LMG 11500 / NCIMB 11436 / LSU 4) TaxID=761193 RepID=A0A7U3ZM41_RUNSL|nr:polyphosphate kinase 2 family protein [Runella slithyformis]AEI49756.1 polyphosphate:nucleotide phosphotransferase, PPK2 family [Runella slithyformis DSM 19594]